MPVIGSLPIAATSSGRERRQLLGDQEGIAAPAHVEHPLVVQVELGLEAVVAAQHLHRQPGRHDLGDGGRDEGLVRVLGDQLVALASITSTSPDGASAATFSLTPAKTPGGQQEKEQVREPDPHGHSHKIETGWECAIKSLRTRYRKHIDGLVPSWLSRKRNELI